MKLSLFTLTLTAGLAAVPLMAQDAPPPAKPPADAPPPAAPPPPPGSPPGLLPAPEAPPAEVPDGFASEKERQSYALGTHFASREKSNASMSGNPLPDAGDVIAGLKDILSGGKSPDYAIGTQLGMNIRRLEVEIDIETFAGAVREVMASQPPKLTPPQQQAVIQRIQTQFQERSAAKRKVEAAKTLQVAEEYIAANSKAEGVKQTQSGLQYRIENEGDGKSPTLDDLVLMNFKGTLVDGTVFEKNPDTGPGRKPVKTLPKGLQEGLALLKTGGKAKFWVPPALGYGETGRLPHIKSNAVLLYEVEILGVEPIPKQPVAGTSPSRPPITAVTPPITVEIPPKPGANPPDAPKPPPPPPPASDSPNKK